MLTSQILASSEVTSVLPSIPQLHTLLSSLCTSSYPAFFPALAEVEQTYLVPSPLLAPHRAYYVKELRIKAYAQLLESYRSLTLERMCRSFGVGEEFMDADLSRFIAAGRLNCRIDKVEGTVVADMDKKKGGKGAGWEGLVKQGDLLLNGMSTLPLSWFSLKWEEVVARHLVNRRMPCCSSKQRHGAWLRASGPQWVSG